MQNSSTFNSIFKLQFKLPKLYSLNWNLILFWFSPSWVILLSYLQVCLPALEISRPPNPFWTRAIKLHRISAVASVFSIFYANGPALPVTYARIPVLFQFLFLPALQFWCKKGFVLQQVSPVSSDFFNTIFSFHGHEIHCFQGQHHQVLHAFTSVKLR